MNTDNARMMIQSGASTNVVRKKDWTYYDDMVVVAAVGTTVLFRNPIGVGGKNLADTNMTIQGMIPNLQKLHIHNIKIFYVASDELADADVVSLHQFLRETTVELQIANQPVEFQFTAMELMGTSMLVTNIPAAGSFPASVPMPNFHGIFPINNVIELPGNSTFEVRVTHHVAPAAGLVDDYFYVGLNGELDILVG